MRKFAVILPAVLLSGAALAASGGFAVADESNDVVIKVKAPLDATSCATTPPTISVLTLSIDVTQAAIEAGEGEGEGDDDGGGTGSTGCDALVAGAPVEVKLVSDVVPLEASKVEQDGEDGEEGSGDTSVQAPVQAVDPTAKTITVLGLAIDASNATLEGDDDDDDGSTQPIDLTQIVVGQIVEIQLDPTKLPSFVATEIELKNFTNQVEIDLSDEHGQQVSDGDDDVSVDVTQTVIVKQKVGKKIKTTKRIVHQQFQTHGSFVLTGLAKGAARVRVTRVTNGVTSAARRAVPVRPNRTQTFKMRLHKTRS